MNSKIQAVKDLVARTQEWRKNPTYSVTVTHKKSGKTYMVNNTGHNGYVMCCSIRDGKCFGPQFAFHTSVLMLAE